MAFEALQAELDLKTSGFTSGMAEAKASMDAVDGQARSMRKGLGMAGGAMSALAVGGLAVAAKAASDFETEMVELQKVSSKEFATDFRSTIMQMSRELPSTANELAGLAAAAKRFGVAEENVESFVRATSKMAIATDINIEDAGESFAKLATLTGTPIPKIENLGSSINALSNTMATSSSEIVDSMLRASGTLSQMGMNQTEIAGLSAAMNAVSESAERAGTRLRRVAQEMMDPAKVGALGQALGVTGDQFKQMVQNDPSGTMLKLAETMNKGGENAEILNRNLSTTSRQALAGLGSNLGQVNQALDTSATAFKENTSLQKEFKAAMGTTDMAVQQLKSSLLAVAIDIGTVLLPYITRAINAFRGLVDAFGVLNSKTGGLAGVIGLLATAIGGALVALAAFWPMISTTATVMAGTFIPAITSAIGSVAAFAAVLAGPLLIPIIAATAAIAALAYAWKTNLGDIQGKVAAFGAEVQRIFGAVTDWLGRFKQVINDVLGGNFGAALTRAEALFREAFTRMGAYVANAGQVIVAGIKQLIARGVAEFTAFRAQLPEMLRQAFEASLAWIHGTGIPTMVAAFKTLASMAVQGLNVLVTQVLPAISNAITTGLNWILTTGVPMATNAIGAIATAIVNTLSTLITILPPIMAEAWDRLYAWLTGPAKTGLASAWNSVISWLTGPGVALARQAFTTIVNTISTVWTLLKTKLPPLLKTAIVGLVNWVQSNGIPLLKKAFVAMVTGALAAWEVFKRDIVPIVSGAILALVNWVAATGKQQTSTAFQSLVTAAANLIETLKVELPAKIKAGVIAMANWVKNNGPGLVKQAFLAIGRGIRTTVLGIVGAGGTLITLFKQGIVAVATYLKNDAWGDLKTAATVMLEALITAGKLYLAARGKLKQLFISGITAVVAYLKNDAWGDLKAAATAMLEALILAGNVYLAVNGKVIGLFKRAIGAIVTYLKGDAWGDLKAAATFLFDVIMAAAEGLYQGLIGGSLIPEMFTAIANYIKNEAWLAISGAVQTIVDEMLSQFDGIKRSIAGDGGIIPTMFSDMLGVFDVFTGDWGKKLTGFYDDTVGKFQELADKIVGNSVIPEMFSSISTAHIQFAKKWLQKWKGLVGDILSALKTWVGNMLSAFGGFSGDLTTDAKNLLKSLLTKFNNKFDAIKSALKKKANAAKDNVIGAITDMKKSVVGPGGIIPNLKSDAVQLIKEIGSAGATAFKRAWNNAIPNSISIPRVSVDIPKELGGGSIGIGGGSVNLPQLATGGFIEETGVFVGHAGERVLNPAETRRYADGEAPRGDIHVDASIQVDELNARDLDDVRDLLDDYSDEQRREIERLLGSAV